MLKICISYNQIIYEYVTVTVTACYIIIPWIYDQGQVSQLRAQRAYMEDIREHVWICTEGDGYIIWGKGIHGVNVFAGGDVDNL